MLHFLIYCFLSNNSPLEKMAHYQCQAYIEKMKNYMLENDYVYEMRFYPSNFSLLHTYKSGLDTNQNKNVKELVMYNAILLHFFYHLDLGVMVACSTLSCVFTHSSLLSCLHEDATSPSEVVALEFFGRTL